MLSKKWRLQIDPISSRQVKRANGASIFISFPLIADQTVDVQKPTARLNIVVQEAFDLQLPMAPAQQRRKHAFLDSYCQITINSITLKTQCAKRTNQPKWDVSMDFTLYNLLEDTIHINLFNYQCFSPNGKFPATEEAMLAITLPIENLGYISVQLPDLLPCPLETYMEQSCFPFTQRIFLNNGASIIVKCALQLL